MGLDLYAGTLGRYYSRNWKTIGEQHFNAKIIYPSGKPNFPTWHEVTKWLRNGEII